MCTQVGRYIGTAASVFFLAFLLSSCGGDDGHDGDDGISCWDLNGNGVADLDTEDTNGDGVVDALDCQGEPGKNAYEVAVDQGFTGSLTDWLLAQQDVGPEICSFCHNGEVARNGATHQEIYDELFQQDVIQVANINYINALGDADGDPATPNVRSDIVTFKLTKNGAAFDCTKADSLNVRYAQYDAAARRFMGDGEGGRISLKGTVTYDGTTNTCTSVNAESVLGDLSRIDGLVVVYGEDEQVEEIGHITLAKYPFAGILELGSNGVDYVSQANATGCENCHQTPYYKHGYIRGDVSDGGGLDFYACKVCHIDDGNGRHTEWQNKVDDPQGWAAGDDPKRDYSYKTRLMNDVHMAHAMEFPYPQPIRTCNTCHAGKLDEVLSDENFRLEVCKSCHPVEGGTDLPDDEGEFAYDTREHSLFAIWEEEGVNTIHRADHGSGEPLDQDCTLCHRFGGIADTFSELHTGFEPRIYYDAEGNRWRDAITASIDEVTLSGSVLDIKFSASGSAGGLNATMIVPTVQVSFYGYDTKDFLVSNHTRDADGNRMEFSIGSEDNALFTNVPTGVPGTWEVMLDYGAFVWDPTIPERIAAGTVKRAEVIVRPRLENEDGDTVGLNAVSETIDVTVDGTKAVIDDYFKGANALVKVEDGCNRCHDQLAITFHSGDRGGNIVVCRSCHVVTNGGSHLEGQSRSIDSYVHAVHRFQAFDVDEIDFGDPVEAALYEEHIEFLFPDFAAVNCERCHTDARVVDDGRRLPFDIPDQSKSMPGLLSATDEVPGRDVNPAPEVVVGPAARACGGCHRAQFIKEDDAQGYVVFNEHTKDFGFRVENDDDDEFLYAIIDLIMGLFN